MERFMSDEEIGRSVPPPVRGFSTSQGDPNITVAEKPHGDVIADRLRAVATDPDSSPEQRQQAESFLSQFYGKPNTPHADVISDTVSQADIDKILPDILDEAEGLHPSEVEQQTENRRGFHSHAQRTYRNN